MNKPYDLKARRNWGKRIKEFCFNLLGSECLRCGFTENRAALAFDHVANDGAAHRKDIGKKTISEWIYKNPAEALLKIQVLCSNCNVIKEMERRRAI